MTAVKAVNVPVQENLRGDIWVSFRSFLKNLPGMTLLGVTLIASYAFQATHTAIGMDDTPAALARYFEQGELILTGRISPFLFNLVLPGYTYNTLAATLFTGALLALAGLVLAAMVYAALGRKADLTGFVLPCVLVSYPLLAEILLFMQQQIGIGMGFFTGAAATALLANHIVFGRWEWPILPGILLLAYSVGNYEAFAAVYLSFFLVLLLAWLWGRTERQPLGRWLLQVMRGVWPLAAALVVKAGAAKLLAVLFADRLVGLTANAAQHVKWLENGLDQFPSTLVSLIGGVIVDYAAMALAYLPMTLLFVGFASLLGVAIFRAVRGRGAAQLLCAFLLCAAQFSLSVLQGQPQFARASECFAVFCAFAVWTVTALLADGGTKPRQIMAAVLALAVVGAQCWRLNWCFGLDYHRWQEEEALLGAVSAHLEQGYDLSKPVVFTGNPQLSEQLVQQNKVPQGNWCYKVGYLCSLVFDMPNTDLYRSPNALTPVVNWSLDAFGYPQTQIYSLYSLLGTEYLPCTMEQQNEALAASETLPAFPQEGSIVDLGDCIVVHF